MSRGAPEAACRAVPRSRRRGRPGSSAFTRVARSPSGAAASPIAKACALLVASAALWVEGIEGLGGRVGQVATRGDEQRRSHRRRHQHRGRDRALPVVFVDEGHRGGPLRDGGRGEDGERHAGRGGRRVGAADPGRVVGGEGRVAEFFGRLGGGRLLFFGRLFGRGGPAPARACRPACSSRHRRARRRRGRRPRRGPGRRSPSAPSGSVCACACRCRRIWRLPGSFGCSPSQPASALIALSSGVAGALDVERLAIQGAHAGRSGRRGVTG